MYVFAVSHRHTLLSAVIITFPSSPLHSLQVVYQSCIHTVTESAPLPDLSHGVMAMNRRAVLHARLAVTLYTSKGV